MMQTNSNMFDDRRTIPLSLPDIFKTATERWKHMEVAEYQNPATSIPEH